MPKRLSRRNVSPPLIARAVVPSGYEVPEGFEQKRLGIGAADPIISAHHTPMRSSRSRSATAIRQAGGR